MSPNKVPVLAIVYIEDFNTEKTEAYIQLKLKKVEKVGWTIHERGHCE